MSGAGALVATNTLSLAVSLRSPGVARRAVRRLCDDDHVRHLLADAELVVSELVANACHVAAEHVTLTLVARHGSVLIAVEDDSAEPLPARSLLPGVSAESGRGLPVVAELATRSGAMRTAGGKTVWVELT